MIRLARPTIGEAELAAVSEVLASGMLVQGARVERFEAELAALTGRAHAIACSSGTAALELALEALGTAGGEVLCPGLSWPSPAHAIVRAGATPVLTDVEASSWNADPGALARARSPRTRAAIVIDQFGTPADHDAIRAAVGALPIVVDAACSLGASYHGRPAGAMGLVATLSFHPRKLVTTGEGGACLTDDAALAARLRRLRNHGQDAPGSFVEAAGNQRLTELAAALGSAQLARLDGMVARRRELAARYRAALDGAVRVQRPPAGAVSNEQTFGAVLPERFDEAARERFVLAMRERGIEVGRLSFALHRAASLRAHVPEGARFPEVDAIADRGVALPLHPDLSDADVARVVDACLALLEPAQR